MYATSGGLRPGDGLSAVGNDQAEGQSLSRFVYVPTVTYAEYDHESFVFFYTIENAVGA